MTKINLYTEHIVIKCIFKLHAIACLSQSCAEDTISVTPASVSATRPGVMCVMHQSIYLQLELFVGSEID